MGRFLTALAILFGVGCTQPDPEARTLVDEGALLLDVRTPGEFQGGHVRDALNIPVQALAQRQGELDSARHVVVYCRSGVRSASAATMLRASGFEVYDMGAMSNWGNADDIVR